MHETISDMIFDMYYILRKVVQGLYSLSGKACYRKISQSLEAARFRFRLFQSLSDLTGSSAVTLSMWLSNSRAMLSFWHLNWRLRDFTMFQRKTSYRKLVNRGPHFDLLCVWRSNKRSFIHVWAEVRATWKNIFQIRKVVMRFKIYAWLVVTVLWFVRNHFALIIHMYWFNMINTKIHCKRSLRENNWIQEKTL